jgi:hypothetical protein
VDARRTPQRIGDADLPDQLPDLGCHCRAPWPAPRFPAPIGSKARAMPAQDRLRPNDRQRTASVREQPTDPTEQQPVGRRKCRSLWPQALQHVDLLSQRQDLCFQTGPRPEQIRNQSKDQLQEIQHRPQDRPILSRQPTGFNLRQGQDMPSSMLRRLRALSSAGVALPRSLVSSGMFGSFFTSED